MVDSSEPKLASFSADEAPKSSKPSSADMSFYYERVLPFRHIFQWLNHSPKPTKDFTMREFAYEYRSGAYQRYNSYASAEEFKKSVVSANPTRFEVGAVYSVNPKERKNLPKSAMKPLSKELVFDIDLTDYDEIRTCCSGTDICTKCWKFIKVASQVLSQALTEDFGFDHFVWVFSGRRGAHCWVSDAKARSLDEITRKSIVEYLDVLGARSSKMGKTSLSLKKPFHPHVERSFDILKMHFQEIVLEDQNPWETSVSSDEKAWGKVDELLSFIPDNALRTALKSKWKESSNYSSSKAKWDDINAVAQKILKHQSQVSQLNDAKKEIIIYFMYPRLDIEVSKQLIHLLKSPFCIHPGTGNICVPFDPTRNLSANSDDDDYGFNPMTAPNLSQLQDEIDTWEAKRVNRDSSQPLSDSEGDQLTSSSRVSDYEKTSLKPYIDYFSSFVNGLLKEELKSSKRDREEDPLEF
ncbi:hypothetical protein FT663_03951 [Candidozyma haemuli var. vulneris]|uniref:DNA primase n=1 Tax=Candidozyma haemuli TaxID=45357 RepID=A0A2V1B205_9ASCO|nr:hypothetical protein CXQ85_003115 [[Candida] haemuloni]KAF3988495.1 hypothetical protein FT662_03364 [[Candida] haemuloni var. vulneris]KAF3988655.1 hypothetical protein FT663_03951 [[Candida] haemuloni var. vulneris]PVH23381.1 hypothetical protein CXQ85_003115 [[Candida] haemuloni]